MQVILARPMKQSKWVTICEDDLDAINRIDELFDGFFHDHHEVFIITGQEEFLDWLDSAGLQDMDFFPFENYVKNNIDFLYSPTGNEAIITWLGSLFAKYKQDNQEESDIFITLNGKRYKLVEV